MVEELKIIDDVKKCGGPETVSQDPKHHSVESLMLMVNADRLKHLDKKSLSGYRELKKVHEQVNTLHRLLKGINKHKDENGALDWSSNEEMQTLLKAAVPLGIEIDLEKKEPFKFTTAEREAMTENIRLTTDDLVAEKEMLLQNVARLTSERLESFQFTRAMCKPTHDDKIYKARAIAGR